MKKVKTKHELWKILPFYKKHLKLAIVVIILSWAYAALGFFGPVYEGKLLALFTDETFTLNAVLITAAIYVGVKIGNSILTYIWGYAVLKLNGKVDYELKVKLLSRLIGLKTKTFDKFNSGVFVSRINKDAAALSQIFDEITDDLAVIILNVSFIAYSFAINAFVGIYIICEIIVLYFINTIGVKNFIKYRIEYKNKDEKVVGLYGEIIRGIRDIKNLFAKDNISKTTNNQQQEVINAGITQTMKRRLWHRVLDISRFLFTFGFIVLCCFLIINGHIELASFLTLYIFRGNIRSMINCLTNLRFKLSEGEVSAKRVFDIIDCVNYEQESFGEKEVSSFDGNIEFKNVKFAYDENVTLFEDLSFKIKQNTFVAFVGKSGEGKTSILELMTKNYEILSGEILFDGHNLYELNEQSIRQNISVVSQEPYIFNMTIKENLLLAKEDATDEEIEDACKKAYIHDFIMSKEDKYDSIIGENGVQLSGGQKQRLAIARAILKNSKIILLDEATSALDNESQKNIKIVLDNLSKDHTVIMIAHRLSTIQDADEIFVLDNHEILTSGTHKTLMKKCDIYKNLYKNEENAANI